MNFLKKVCWQDWGAVGYPSSKSAREPMVGVSRERGKGGFAEKARGLPGGGKRENGTLKREYFCKILLTNVLPHFNMALDKTEKEGGG